MSQCLEFLRYFQHQRCGSIGGNNVRKNKILHPSFYVICKVLARVRTDLEKSWKMTLVLENSWNSKEVSFVLELSWNFEKTSLIILKSLENDRNSFFGCSAHKKSRELQNL